MKNLIFYFFMLFNIFHLEAYMAHREAPFEQEWKEENLSPFDELILSWNGMRPTEGKLLFYVSAKVNEWSPWLLYASWGSDGQSSFSNSAPENFVKVYQDTFEVLEGKKATGFKIKIVPEDCVLYNIHHLHVYTNGNTPQLLPERLPSSNLIHIDVPGLSQMTINHARHNALCSPTSTTAVIRYLSNNDAIDPIYFAQNVWDRGFDIFGNWVFNVAQASSELGSSWSCWVERLNGFDQIHQRLIQGTPIIVSVRGPLHGSALSYSAGHLMVVIGYDSLNQKVICMDPAFPSDDQTHVSYDLSNFIEAWSRRGKVAYIFSKNL